MIIRHWREVVWDPQRWPNFAPEELACPCCGRFFVDVASFDGLQAMRTALGRTVRLNSAHRCGLHNARVGGRPLSQHLRFAADISLHGHTPSRLLAEARAAGFTGFGLYQTFLHIDRGPARTWRARGWERTWKTS